MNRTPTQAGQRDRATQAALGSAARPREEYRLRDLIERLDLALDTYIGEGDRVVIEEAAAYLSELYFGDHGASHMNTRECGGIDRTARIDEAAVELTADRSIGPRARCFICGCGLTDPVSISYGIGPECWPDVRGVFQDDLDTPIPDDPEGPR